MDRSESPITIKTLQGALTEVVNDLACWVAGLDDRQRLTPGQEGWSVKDHIAHLIIWADGIDALLNHRPRAAAMGISDQLFWSGDFEQINAIAQSLHKERSWGAVWQEFLVVTRRLHETLSTLTDEDLLRSYSFYQPAEPGQDSGAPIVGWIIGNSFEHVEEHRPWMEQIVHDLDAAQA